MRFLALFRYSSSGAILSREINPSSFSGSFRKRVLRSFSTRGFPVKTNPRPQLEDFFSRVQWPTTKAEEAELVESVGNAIWEGHNGDKRKNMEEKAAVKRRKIETGEAQAPIYATEFSKEEIESEERRPKKKCAILLGYSGTGYFGMQLNENQKTIEGELFAALVAAGAISKANGADPKKSSFVRCARTDKGVHAAGNVVSLKMIVEDSDIVQKINEQLSPQIRVWGVEQTSKAFNCYQLCDSRVYEYLMPSHCLLPPHPSTFLGKKIVEQAEKAGDSDAVKARQEEVTGYWEKVDEEYIKPILGNLPKDVREVVQKSLWHQETQEGALDPDDGFGTASETREIEQSQLAAGGEESGQKTTNPSAMDPRQRLIFDTVKSIKAAYIKARRAYRIPSTRITRLQGCLTQYVGTKNFHNYTIQKTFTDPSAKRHIKSFNVNPEPVVINGTEWLSLKVHGQSFMMHQIRKMVAMAVMVVRAGCTPTRISETYGAERIAIPKAPGLGLLLERPIFDSYNTKAAGLGRGPVSFEQFANEMDEFKQREIYDRIFREEEQTAAFASFFNHVDHYPIEYFLYVTSGGLEVARLGSAPAANDGQQSMRDKNEKSRREALAAVESGSDSEGKLPDDGEEGG